MKKKITKTGDSQTIVLRNQLARALADYDNLRKRVEREKEGFEKLASLRLTLKLLPVLDALKQAQNHLKDQGVAITIGQFEDALKQEGIEGINAKAGDEFNPELHEVIEVVPGKSDNIISEVSLPGYRFIDGLLIRYAKVKVAKSGTIQ